MELKEKLDVAEIHATNAIMLQKVLEEALKYLEMEDGQNSRHIYLCELIENELKKITDLF